MALIYVISIVILGLNEEFSVKSFRPCICINSSIQNRQPTCSNNIYSYCLSCATAKHISGWNFR